MTEIFALSRWVKNIVLQTCIEDNTNEYISSSINFWSHLIRTCGAISLPFDCEDLLLGIETFG